MRPLHRLLVTLVAALASAAALALAAAPASAQTPSLEGESLVSPEPDIVAHCDPLGTSTITFRAEGLALGPYSGTFVEEGTATMTGIGGGALLSFESTFTIHALTGEVVTGRKTLLAPGFGQCSAIQALAFPILSYEATITTASGSFRDTGEASAFVNGSGCLPDCAVDAFLENFTSSDGVLPVFTSGKATGGGQLLDATTQRRVTFGFEVKSTEDPNRLQGRCLVFDRASDTRVKCLDVRNYEEVGNTARWEGTAEVNGDREDYRISVQDNGEPNQGLDTFSIVTETYEAAGNVTHGNVQVHKHQVATP